jgi:succinate dehydrogenase / fumarate reductase cytochrome b subunit
MTEKIKLTERPLSPHLQVYRLPITALMSISHRITGVALVFGAIFISTWFIAAVMGEQYYNQLMSFSQGWLGTLMIFGWSLALFYHLCNGLRHLLWDVGIGLDKCGAKKGHFFVLLFTALLTVCVWFCPFAPNSSPDSSKVETAVTEHAVEIRENIQSEGE